MAHNREPVFAGQFYPYDKESLNRQLEKFFSGAEVKPKKAIAGIAPHAGYVYSGPVAAHFYKSIQKTQYETIVIIGPNHTGFGPDVGVYPEGTWETPLGNVSVDAELAKKIDAEQSEDAHASEHSLEVQLPFLQFALKTGFKVVPICVMDQSIGVMTKLGENLAKVLDKNKHLVIASTDFSHYVQQKTALENDLHAIDAIKKLDTKDLYETIQKYNVSMCGYGPVAATMTYAKKAGSKSGELLKYATSGDVTGDFRQVVGYGALAFY